MYFSGFFSIFFSSLINYIKIPIHTVFLYPVNNVALFFFLMNKDILTGLMTSCLLFLECLLASFVKTSGRQTTSAKTINKHLNPKEFGYFQFSSHTTTNKS